MDLENLVITSERLGEGGFGSVFICQLDGKKVAAKKLSQSEKEISNLVNEAARLKRLQHGKHIAYTYDFTRKDGNLYMVMEYCERGDLQNYLKGNRESVTYEQKILFCRGILLGLLYCHSMNIFHGDIKCSNVILGENLEPKLADFGLSMTVNNIEDYCKTYEGSIHWAAPELFSMEDESDFEGFKANPYPTDVYSLGATFCQVSFDGTTDFIDSDYIETNISLGLVSPVSRDGFLEEIIDGCCQFERNERISLDECLTLLDSVAEEQLPIPAIDDKWQEIQQDIKVNSKHDPPPPFILHRPKENLVVGPSNLSLLEWLCINNCADAVEYMTGLHKYDQDQIEWLREISELCGSSKVIEFLQSFMPNMEFSFLKLSNLIDNYPQQFIDAFVKVGASYNQDDLLDKAVERHYNRLVQFLVENASACKRTVMHGAVEYGNSEAVKILAEHVNLEFRDTNGDTPLLAAISAENVEIVKILLGYNADVHNKNSLSRSNTIIGGQHTPLYRAAVKGNHEIVELLINAGATVNTKSSEWHSLVQDLEQCGKSSIIQFISDEMKKKKKKTEYSLLCTAIRKRQSGIVQKLIDDGANANECNYDEYSPLHWAAAIEDEEIVRILLKAGADINVKNAYGRTPLFLCVDKSLRDMVHFLTEKGADVNARDKSGFTSIHCAKDKQIAEILVAHGADINAKSKDGRTLLFLCVDKSLRDIVQFLIEKGADVNARADHEYTPIHYAKDKQIAEILIAHGADINTKGTDGRTPLFVYVDKSLRDMVQFLIEKGADVNAVIEHGFAPIHCAKDKKIAEILIAHGADINTKGTDGRTLLFKCVDESLRDIVQFLIEKGADVNARDKSGFTPIHLAKDKEIAEILIAHSADINAKNTDGRTPLFVYVDKSLRDMVQFLIEKGADVNARNEDGFAPIHCAKDKQIAEILIAHGADINAKTIDRVTPLFECVDESLVDIVQFLIEKGADVNARNEDGFAPIHYVKNKEIAEILVAHSADINAKSIDGLTPLFKCVDESLVDIVQFLIEQGADVNARNENGFAPIHYVKNKGIAEILVAYGADINAKSTNDRTPLFECVTESLVDITQFLIEKGADVNARDKSGLAPIHCAKDKEIAEILIANYADINAKNKDGKTLFNILLEEQSKNLSNAAYKRKEVCELLEYLENLK